MVRLDLRAGDTPLYVASRPMLVVPEPRYVRWLARLPRVVLRPFQRAPMAPTQTVRIPLLHRVTPWARLGGQERMATHADLVLHTHEVRVYGAALRFDAHLTGVIYWMYHHTLACLGVFLCLFAGIELAVAGAIWLGLAAYFSWGAPRR